MNIRVDSESDANGGREVSNYRDLIAWQKGVDLVVESYRAAEAFPTSELYGLTSQLRRAALSVPANVAEGRGRLHLKEFIYHLGVAQGSLCELETHVEVARRLGYLTLVASSRLEQRTTELTRILHGLQNSLRRRVRPSPDACPR